jgi:serine/threonine protein phosphatase PrpC
MCLGAAKSGDLDDRQKAPVVLKKILSDYGDKVAESQQEMVEKKAKKTPGSTASIAHCSKDRILTIANAGDSRFTLFFRRADGSFGFKRLTSDARADKPFEMFRIANEQGAVRYADGVYRVKGGGNPMISRSLGDCAVRGDSEKGNKLVAHEADMSQHDIAAIAKAENASQVFLVGGTDALFELAHEKKYVAALELWHSDKKLQKSYNHNIAEYFRDLAVVFGSADNATVCVADLSQPLSEGLFVGMFDGHSDGAELSSDAANKIFNELSAEGKDVKDVKNVPETKIKNAKARDLAAPTPSLKYVKAQQLTQKAAERTCVIL